MPLYVPGFASIRTPVHLKKGKHVAVQYDYVVLHLEEESVAERLPVCSPALQEEARPHALEERLHPAGLPELTTQHGVGQARDLGNTGEEEATQLVLGQPRKRKKIKSYFLPW